MPVYGNNNGDFNLTADASSYMNAQLERKLPPPSNHLLFSAGQCNCHGTVHEPECRHEQAVRASLVAQSSAAHHQQQQQQQHHQQQHILPSMQQQHAHSHLSMASSTNAMGHTGQNVQSGSILPQPRSEEDFPMDAVFTLMQLNNGWRTLGGVSQGAAAAAAVAAVAASSATNGGIQAPMATMTSGACGNPPMVTAMTWPSSQTAATLVHPEPMTPSLSHSSTLSSNSSASSENSFQV
jgi:hypothetical protein